MCTIGNVFSPNNQGMKGSMSQRIVFKQCDLMGKTVFYEPQIATGTEGIRYMPFLRKGSSGPWSGVNEYGVSFVAADSYINETGKAQMTGEKNGSIFDAYLKIIAGYKTAREAANYMKAFYQNDFKEPDILMIADFDDCFFIESWNGKVQMVERPSGFFASTNHFRMIYNAVPYRSNHSTYLRLQRAESILQSSPGKAGVEQLLCDEYYGKTVWSICRTAQDVPAEEEPFFTQASVIFWLNKNLSLRADKISVDIDYVINGNPCNGEWKHIHNAFNLTNKIKEK